MHQGMLCIAFGHLFRASCQLRWLHEFHHASASARGAPCTKACVALPSDTHRECHASFIGCMVFIMHAHLRVVPRAPKACFPLPSDSLSVCHASFAGCMTSSCERISARCYMHQGMLCIAFGHLFRVSCQLLWLHDFHHASALCTVLHAPRYTLHGHLVRSVMPASLAA